MNDVYIELVERIGDIVACEPVSKYLRQKYPDKKIFWIVNKNYKDIVAYNPYIDGIIYVDSLFEADEFCNNKRNNGDIIINLHYDGYICSKTKKSHKNNNNSLITDKNIFSNGRSILNSFSQVAGLEPLDDAPEFHLKEDLVLPEYLPNEYIVFHCKSSMQTKDWTVKKWNELAKKIAKTGVKIVEIGQEQIIKLDSPNYCNCTNINDLQTIALIIKNAKCFIGIDSAFSHIANCFNIYSILIFGKYMRFRLYNPYSGNFGKNQNCTIIFNICGYTIDIPDYVVYNAFKDFIQNKTNKMNRLICLRLFTFKKLIQTIFSVYNEYSFDAKKHKIIIFCGIKIKLRK